VPVLSLQVPEKEPRNATYVYWLWHSIYQENADLFPPPPCTRDIMGSLTLRIMVRCRLRVTDVCFLLKFMRADAAAAERTPIPVSHTFPPRDKLSPHKNLSPVIFMFAAVATTAGVPYLSCLVKHFSCDVVTSQRLNVSSNFFQLLVAHHSSFLQELTL